MDAAAYAASPESAGVPLLSWCTPYALSIMGTEYTSNCPFGNGNGYGDGRAASVGEVAPFVHCLLVPCAHCGLLVGGMNWSNQLLTEQAAATIYS